MYSFIKAGMDLEQLCTQKLKDMATFAIIVLVAASVVMSSQQVWTDHREPQLQSSPSDTGETVR